MEVGKPERFAWYFAGICADQRRNQIAVLLERLAKRRQRCQRLRQTGLLRGQFYFAAASGIKTLFNCRHRSSIDGDELKGCLDLSAQRRFGNGCDRYIRRQREVDGFGLKTLGVRQRLKRFQPSVG